MNTSFNTLWKEDLSLLPNMPLDYNEREKFRIFAEEIFKQMERDIQSRLDEAYENGYVDGQNNCED
jgi:hypothetical protein